MQDEVVLQATRYDAHVIKSFTWDDGAPRRLARIEALVGAHLFGAIVAKAGDRRLSLGDMVVLRPASSSSNILENRSVVMPLWVDPSIKPPRSTTTPGGKGDRSINTVERIFIKLKEAESPKLLMQNNNNDKEDWSSGCLKQWIANDVLLRVTPFVERISDNSWGRIVLTGPIQTIHPSSSTVPSPARAKQILLEEGVIHEGQIIHIPSYGWFRCSCYPERIACRWQRHFSEIEDFVDLAENSEIETGQLEASAPQQPWSLGMEGVWPVDDEEKLREAPRRDISEWRYVEDSLRVCFQSEEEGITIRAIERRLRNRVGDIDPFFSFDDQRAFIRVLIGIALWPSQNLERLPKCLSRPSGGVLISGPPGTGKTALIIGLAVEAGVPIISVTAAKVSMLFPGEIQPQTFLHFIQLAKQMQPCILLFDEMDILFPAPESSEGDEGVTSRVYTFWASMDELSPEDRVLVVGITNRLAGLHSTIRERFVDKYVLDIPTPAKRLQIFKHYLATQSSVVVDTEATGLQEKSSSGRPKSIRLVGDIPLEIISDRCHGFVGADVAALCRDALALSVERARVEKIGAPGVLEISTADLAALAAETRPSALREVLVTSPHVHWDDIGGLAEVKMKLKQTVVWAYERKEDYRRMGIVPPKGILLYGPPGTGKTLLCSAVATESRANFISVNISDLVQSEIGESEKRLVEIFRRARACSPCIIFFDEIQAIFGTRESAGSSGRMMISQLLLEMDAMNGIKMSWDKDAEMADVIVIAATNCPDMIDSSFFRLGRFDRCIYVGPPDAEGREAILRIQMQKMKRLSDNISLPEIVERTENHTGADLNNVCRKAALSALMQGKQAVGQEHFLEAIKTSAPSVSEEALEKLRQWRM